MYVRKYVYVCMEYKCMCCIYVLYVYMHVCMYVYICISVLICVFCGKFVSTNLILWMFFLKCVNE